ncbi:lysoplasmalogenase [Mesorhizobium sp. CAU 1741]|uniref:lysoplasmalogenase n=1 Tax=Mesorhizobium sp. CAU 1741 TaxID=3140366 RepID=UPI00325AC2E0
MPFPGGIESLSNGTLLFSAVAAFFYLLMQARAPSWRRTAMKAGSIGLLALLVAIEGGPFLLVAALVLSAIGDAFLAQEDDRAFLAGLASFLAAHIVYVTLFLLAGGGVEILMAQPWRVGLPLIAVAAAIPLTVRLLPAVGSSLRLPVTAYVTAILAMMLAAATVSAPLVMVGAALFLASDAILAAERFLVLPDSTHRAWTGPAVWVIYYLAQLSIALGFIL